MYYSNKTAVECGVDKSTEPGKAIANELKPTLTLGAPIVIISYKDKSIDKAKKCLESVFNDIRTKQNEIAKPIFEQKKYQLSKIKKKLESAEQITKILASKKPNFDFPDSQFSTSVLLLATTLVKENEVSHLRDLISDLEITLAEPQTIETYLTTPINAPNIRVDLKKPLMVLGSAIGGLILVITFLIVRREWAKIKVAKQAT